jgi:hypothetical protein
MKFSTVLLSGLLASSQFIVSVSSHSVYYEEFKALKNAPKTHMLFDQDVDGGSHTTQCNLEMYRPVGSNFEDLAIYGWLDQVRRFIALGNIHRIIAMGKELSWFNHILQAGLCDINADLLIVTPETMPSLYDYVETLSKKAKIATPVVFVSLKQGFFKTFSRKMLMFTGSIVIGQQILHDVSDEELEALVAQQIGHIKYHHYNKNFLLQAAAAYGVAHLVFSKEYENKFLTWFVIPALTSVIMNKRFERQADTFACKQAGKSNGIIAFYERLQAKDHARAAEFGAVSHIIQENAAELPMLTYIGLMMNYYLAKAEHCVAGVYNQFAYPSSQARIHAAQKHIS